MEALMSDRWEAQPEQPFWIVVGEKSYPGHAPVQNFQRVRAQTKDEAEAQFARRTPDFRITSIAKEVEWRP